MLISTFPHSVVLLLPFVTAPFKLVLNCHSVCVLLIIELMKQFEQVSVKAKQTWQSELRRGGWAAEIWAFKQVLFKINEVTELVMMQRTKIQRLYLHEIFHQKKKSVWEAKRCKDQLCFHECLKTWAVLTTDTLLCWWGTLTNSH